MRARMATFQAEDPAKADEEIATTRRYLEGGRTAGRIPATGFLMLVDHEAGKVIEVLLSESDEDLQQGDETMNSYAPGEGSMHRISVERFDVPVRLLRCRLGGTWTDLVTKITAIRTAEIVSRMRR